MLGFHLFNSLLFLFKELYIRQIKNDLCKNLFKLAPPGSNTKTHAALVK